jgi:RNA polymerase sigma-70 factor (ECF subfamily)
VQHSDPPNADSDPANADKETRLGHGPSTKVVLLSRIGDRDEQAWSEFVELYSPLIRRYCQRFGLQDADAEDVAQAVFRNLVQFIDQFAYDPERGRFRSWLGVVVTREIQRHLRKHGRPGRAPGEGAHDALLEDVACRVDPSWCDDFNTSVLQQAWSRVMPSFDEATQSAFQQTWIEGVDPRQAASDLDKPVAWVYKARYRVLKKLKVQLRILCMDEPSLHR